MGQQIARLTTGGELPYDYSSSEQQDPVLSSSEGSSSHGEDANDMEEHSSHEDDMQVLEQLADDFMNRNAFKAVAAEYGIEDNYLSPDLPMEETAIEDDYYSMDEKSQETSFRFGNRGSLTASNSTVGMRAAGMRFKWQKGALIGSGSFGRVFLGLNLMSGGFMAVKQVELSEEQIAHHKAEVSALQNEITLLQSLKHVNIVQYLGSSVEGTCLNIFLEYVPGGSISSLIKKFTATDSEGLPESLIAHYTKQILTGLQYLHSNQIIHRDIKGANILVDDKGNIKLADFGASKKIEEIVAHVGAGESFASLKGTVYWMAPEVIRQTGYGRQADIWSVGCTVIEMATGRPPWYNSAFTDQISALFTIATSDELPPMPEMFSDTGKDFLAQCFRRNPKERPNATKLLQHPWLNSSSAPPTKRSSVSRSRPDSVNLGYLNSSRQSDYSGSPRSDFSYASLPSSLATMSNSMRTDDMEKSPRNLSTQEDMKTPSESE